MVVCVERGWAEESADHHHPTEAAGPCSSLQREEEGGWSREADVTKRFLAPRLDKSGWVYETFVVEDLSEHTAYN